MQTRANKRGAGKGGITVLFDAERPSPALPDRERWAEDSRDARQFWLSNAI